MEYYHPKTDHVVEDGTVTIEWRMTSQDKIKKVTLYVNAIQYEEDGINFREGAYRFGKVFRGETGKSQTFTLTGLPKNESFAWGLLVQTNKETISFYYPEVELSQESWRYRLRVDPIGFFRTE